LGYLHPIIGGMSERRNEQANLQFPEFDVIGIAADADQTQVWRASGGTPPRDVVTVGQAQASELRVRNSVDDIPIPSQN